MKQYVFSIEGIHGLGDYDVKKGGILEIKNSENDIPITKRVKVIEILEVKITDQVTDVELLVEDVKPLITFLGDPNEEWDHQKLELISQSENNYMTYNELTELAQGCEMFSQPSITITYDSEGNFISESLHK